MDIRPYNESDVPAISRLYFNTIHRVNARDYTPQQIRAWAPTIYGNSYWLQRFVKRRVLVAEDKGRILGFAEFETSGHIDCFYVHHEHQHRGIGSLLMNGLESEFRTLNVGRLFAEVSVTARDFFESRGFTVVEERNQEYRSVTFKLFLMQKYLARGSQAGG